MCTFGFGGRGGWGQARSYLAQKALLIYKSSEVGELLEKSNQRGAFSPHSSPSHASASPSPGVILGFQMLTSHSFSQQVLLNLASAELSAKG